MIPQATPAQPGGLRLALCVTV